MRYIIECTVPDNLEAGIDAIRELSKNPELEKMAIRYTEGGDWFVRETKTGYSAKLVKFEETEIDS